RCQACSSYPGLLSSYLGTHIRTRTCTSQWRLRSEISILVMTAAGGALLHGGGGQGGRGLEPFTLGGGRRGFRLEVSEGNVVEQYLGRMPQAVVDKADVGAPALVLDNGPQFFLAFPGLPEFRKVEIVVAQVGQLTAQLAGAHVAVEVDDDTRVAGGAG